MKKSLFALIFLFTLPTWAAMPYSGSIDVCLQNHDIAAKDVGKDFTENVLVEEIAKKIKNDLNNTYDVTQDFIWVSGISCKVVIDDKKKEAVRCDFHGGVSPLVNIGIPGHEADDHLMMVSNGPFFHCNYETVTPMILEGIKGTGKKN